MIRSSHLGFIVFVGMVVVFFILPDPEGLQKPFRVLLGLTFAITYTTLLIKKEISGKTLWPVIAGGIFLLIMLYRGTLQTSFINAYLCLFGLLCLPYLLFPLTPIRKTNLTYLLILSMVSFLVQFLIFSSADGRPRLGYEINLSGAYLFLFFLACEVLNFRPGKLLVIALSLLTLSRLLIFSILLFYLIRATKKYLRPQLERIKAAQLAIGGYVVITLFSLWYVANIKKQMDYETGIRRIAHLNDGSNQLRFLGNTLVVGTVASAPLSPKVLFGFGPVENFMKADKGSLIMPHNELFDGIVEFGLITTIFFALVSLPLFSRITTFHNIEFLLPILFYTLFLWVRFLIVPSFEMLFILMLMYQGSKE